MLVLTCNASAQLYIRGEVKDENNQPISNAKIVLHSTGFLYYSGSAGAFGIVTEHKTDSITVSLSGYQSISLLVDPSKYTQVLLRSLPDKVTFQKNKLL